MHDIEDPERDRRPQRDRLGALDGQRLGGQLAQHRVQEGDDGQADARPPGCGPCARSRRPRRAAGPEQRGEGGLAQPAQGQRGQGDAELAGRQIGGELLGDGEQQPGAPPPFAGQLLQPGGPDLDEGELRRDEEGVGQDHHHGQQQRERRVHGAGRIAQPTQRVVMSRRCARPAGNCPEVMPGCSPFDIDWALTACVGSSRARRPPRRRADVVGRVRHRQPARPPDAGARPGHARRLPARHRRQRRARRGAVGRARSASSSTPRPAR